jgi:hypothetical protein
MLCLCVFVLINRPIRAIKSITETRQIHSWIYATNQIIFFQRHGIKSLNYVPEPDFRCFWDAYIFSPLVVRIQRRQNYSYLMSIR